MRAGATRRPASTIDSRRVEPGDLFVAVGGGADFVGEALARGAAAALVPEDAFAALAALGARGARPRSDARVVGDHRLDRQDVDEGHPGRALSGRTARTVAAEESQNNEIGLPLTLSRIEPDTEVVVARDGHARARARSPSSARSRRPTSA